MDQTNKIANPINNLSYDKTSAISIFEYSKGLLGRSLREFIKENYSPKKGKGSIGQMVENLYFLLETNNNPEADFSSAGMELKCTPLKLGKNDTYLIKERLVCNMINYCEVVKEDFEQSHFYLKCQLMLLLFYLYKKNCDNLDLKFIFSVLWKLPEKDLLIIKHDYETILEKIKCGKAHLLSEGDTMYLGACRKGQKGDSLMKQPFSEEGAPRRAFSLKMSYMRTILQYVTDSGKDISNNPKNKFAIIANAIAATGKCANVNRSEEFMKAGLTMKTIRVQHNGNIKEAMSFENIDYIEVAECDNWYESRLYELFSSRFMFVIFKEQTANKGDYILDNVFFWTMPPEDLEWAETYWMHIKKNILEDHISEEYWWKGQDKKKFHVRPKAQRSTDLAPTPSGKWAKKFCYWFNNDYVKQIVNNNGSK